MLQNVVYIISTASYEMKNGGGNMREWLRNARNKAGLTQEQVAERVGIARATYGHIESGERGVTVSNAKKISEVLDFHWTIFFEDESHVMKNKRSVV